MQLRTSIVVPAFNEADGLLPRLAAICAFLESRYAGEYEVIVVDDGSTDATPRLLLAALDRFPALNVETHERNLGLNAAIRTGIAVARGRSIAILDADLTYEPHTAGRLIDAVERGAHIALASPYAKGGRCIGIPFTRALLSRWANRYLALAVNGRIATLTAVVRAYDASAATALLLEGAFGECTFGVLLHAVRRGMRVEEVPAVLDWSDQPRSRARRLNACKLAIHTAAVLAAGIRMRPALIAALPGLVPGLLPAVATAAFALHARPAEIAAATGVTLAVQCASLSLFSFQLGTFLRRKHVHRTPATPHAT